MYDVIKSVINNGRYNLNDIIKKIDSLWVSSDLTDSERDELIKLARTNANVSDSLNLTDKYIDLEKRVSALEKKLNSSDPVVPQNEYPDYVEGKPYSKGDKITYKGKKYECIVPSYTTCVWSPEAFPDYWKLIA